MNETWVTISGNVVDDPRHRQTTGGSVTSFRLATSPSRLRDGQWSDGPASFYDVSCWNRMAVNVASCVHKGQPLVVHGRLAVREWVTDAGRGRSAEITADHVGHDLKWGTSAFLRSARLTPADADQPIRDEPAGVETNLGLDAVPVAESGLRSSAESHAPAAAAEADDASAAA